MYEEDRLLAENCERLARETGEAAAWLADNRELAGRDLESHEKELRKAGRLFRGCAVAARRKMCLGVFGPSQAGKSYLVSTLAGDASGRLLTRLGDREYDFLSEINPAGGKESTGLVTRFTLTGEEATKKAPLEPDAYPVHVRLLSSVDIVKILANTYFSDAEHMESPDRDALLTALTELETKKRGAPTGGMTEDDVEDLQEYIVKYFRGKARVQQLLDRHFWARVIPLAPLLEDEDRAALFGLIWDGIESFTGLLLSLFKAMRALDFAPEAFLPIGALIPRERSVIDVATLGSLTPEADDELSVITSSGVRASIARVYATALTAELVIPMSHKPADFFDHTDLLDFPGYRSRKIFVDLAKETQEPAKLKECFLRGKVAYLFERYCAERELTGLLLCIGSGPQEVQGLGGAVNEWITGTHGATPEKRAGKEKSLFFILTKSDLEFEDKAGAKDVSERWETRMFASKEVFSSHEWLMKWDADKSFDNFFLMRNPTVKLYLFNHDSAGRETALKEEMVPWVGEFERAFLSSPSVTAHFVDKESSWRAFMTPNDGGLSLIRSRLAPICKPELKRRQILATLEEQSARLRDRLHPYWHTDDKEEERKQKAILAQNLARVVLGMIRPRRFGAFSRLLTVLDQDIYDLYFQAQYRMREELSAPPPGGEAPCNGQTASSGSVDDLLADLLGEEAVAQKPQPSGQAGTPAQDGLEKDEASAFGAQIEQYWLAGLRAQAEDPVLQQYFAFDAGLFSQFVQEIGVGFIRLGVRAEMEDALRKAARYANVEKERLLWKQAGLAAGIINRYADWLGFDPRLKNEKERTLTFGSRQRTLFNPPPETRGLPALAEDPGDYAESVAMDWSAALIHLIQGNVNFDGARDFDPVQNNRLRAILDALCIH